MKIYLFFTLSICAMTIGHIFKIKRWSLFIDIYEKSSFKTLTESLSIGHLINLVIPFRIGDLFRIVHAGKKMKNGIPFSFATVISDLYFDFLTVGGMFLVLVIIDKGGERLLSVAKIYGVIFIILVCITLVCVLERKFVKKIIVFIAKIFNENIQFMILYTAYLTISSIKDIFNKIKKEKFASYTFLMWSSYVLSYVLFADTLQMSGNTIIASEIFSDLFYNFNIFKVDKNYLIFWMIYMIMPLLFCFLISKIIKDNQNHKDRFVLPQLNKSDKIAFLKTYYEGNKKNYINNYLEINEDVTVVTDNSAGSNASTVIIMKNDTLYYRKYAFGQDGKKLYEQIEWIKNNQDKIPLPAITYEKKDENYCVYDMPLYANSVGLFQYIHTMPVGKSWRIIEKAMSDLQNGIYSLKAAVSNYEIIDKYISEKIEKNLLIILNSKIISMLEKYDTINVNGKELKTLKNYKDMLDKSHLRNIFINDCCSDIHGDLTIENIVCLINNEEIDINNYSNKIIPHDYYFIDPNTGNIHNSPFLDYAKLLQSLHGNYEFLMKVQSVNIDKNQVNFLLTTSEAYSILQDKTERVFKGSF